MKRWHRNLVALSAIGLFLCLWEFSVPLGLVSNVDLVSKPSLVAVALVQLVREDEVFPHLGVSLREFFVGLVLSLIVGIPLGAALGRYRTLAMLLDPLLMALYTTPRLAMLPLLMVAFGVGAGATTAVVFLSAIFPILVNVATGIREADPVWIKAVRSFGGGEWQIFTKVLLPGAVPATVTGVRLAIGRGLLGMVVGEMYVTVSGIGSQISVYGKAFKVAELMALILLVSLFGFAMVELVRRIELWFYRGREA